MEGSDFLHDDLIAELISAGVASSKVCLVLFFSGAIAGPVTPQGTGFLAVQTVAGTKVSLRVSQSETASSKGSTTSWCARHEQIFELTELTS